MDKDAIKQSLTINKIKELLDYFNADYKVSDKGELIIETICHNRSNGSHKLYYYPESESFHCYTDCSESFDVFDLVMKVSKVRGNTLNFYQSVELLADILRIDIQKSNKVVGFTRQTKQINDWDWIKKIQRRKVHKPEFKVIDESILNAFPKWVPDVWYKEGISIETMKKYGIRFNPEMNQTIIPHRDDVGRLIGIRTRNWRDTSKGKYMPLFYNGQMYNHPLGYNLYGLHENIDAIKRLKKVMIVEGEKSAMKSHSMFKDNNFCVALCGSNMNKYQADLLISLGVEQVIIAIDKDYLIEPDAGYYNRVKKIAQHFFNKVDVYHITDTRHQISFKSCLLDENESTVIDVMDKEKYLITDIERIENHNEGTEEE